MIAVLVIVLLLILAAIAAELWERFTWVPLTREQQVQRIVQQAQDQLDAVAREAFNAVLKNTGKAASACPKDPS